MTLDRIPGPIGKALRAARRYYRVAQALFALLGNVVAERPTELWIGDSHSVFLTERWTSARFTRTVEGRLVWHLGPRLMYSISRNGLPRPVLRAAVAWRTVATRSPLTLVLTLGEIDIRCHLGTREAIDWSFVDRYVRTSHALAARAGADRVIFTVPVPPSQQHHVNDQFPVRGTIEQRVGAFEAMRAALHGAVTDTGTRPHVMLLDATDLLADANGAFATTLTDDGCHTNEVGATLVRQRLDSLAAFGHRRSTGLRRQNSGRPSP